MKRLLAILLTAFVLAPALRAQTARIADAWWTFQQDCNGDGCKAGTLSGDKARLNWEPTVTNCNGTLTVFEIVYSKSCAASTWTPLYTNSPHVIVGCGSAGAQFLDVAMAAGCTCKDYRIEIYRNGQAAFDYVRQSTNDVDLNDHSEQLLADDFCLSDYFATCVALSGSTGSQTDSSDFATKEAGEPNHAGNAGGHSLWYCWTAPTNRPVTFDTVGSSFDTLLAVYTGVNVSSLTLITNNDDIAGSTNRLSAVTFTPTTGVTYRIAVDGFGGGSGITQLNWNQTGQALPDLIFWAPSVSPTITTRTFSSGECEVVEGCETVGTHKLLSFGTHTRNIGNGDLRLGDPATNSLFVFASCHAHYHFEHFAEYHLLDTNNNIVVSGHKVGFCLLDDHPWSPTANPTAIYNCNFQGIQRGWYDSYSASLPCQYIDITGVPAGDYYLQMTVNPDNLIVESDYANNTILVPVTIPPTNCLSAPPNDAFTNAVVVDTTPFSASEFNNCATKETGEPNHAGNAGGHSIWYRWTPTSNHVAVITTKRSNFDTLLAVYTGNSVSSLALVATNDDIVPSVRIQSQVTFAATAGTTYRIAVDGWNGAVGNVTLNVNPAANDDATNAFLLSGSAGKTNGFTLGASKEAQEPAHAFDVGGHSIWYRWVAPITGPVDFNTSGSSFDTTLAVYTNVTVLSTNSLAIAANDDDPQGGGAYSSRVSFVAAAGQTYRIAVDGFGGDFGQVTLNWNMDSRLAISGLPDGKVGVTLTGVDWQRYTLLGSTNLSGWTTNVPTITLYGGSHTYTNSPATNVSPRQFFRAIRSP